MGQGKNLQESFKIEHGVYKKIVCIDISWSVPVLM